MDIEISVAKSEDLQSILELQEISLKLLTSNEYNATQIESLIRDQKSVRSELEEIIFVAYFGSKLVGFASLLRHTPVIGAVFVHPDFTRRSIGTSLVKAIENTAITKKYQTIYVTSSLSAVNFYISMGYEKTQKSGFLAERKVWIPCVNMKKRLIPMTAMERLMGQIILVVIYMSILLISILILMQVFEYLILYFK